jgi:hypothetical protein
MTRSCGLLLCLVLAAFGGRATACINDRELPTHEREFRSQYGGLAGLPAKDEPDHHFRVPNNLLMGWGAALLVGAFALAARRTQSRA